MDLGTKTYTVKSTEGKRLGTISFNPYDASMIVRYKEAFKNIGEMLAPLAGISIKADGTIANSKDNHVLQTAESAFKKAFDTAFSEGTYESFFAEIHPFAAQGGTFYSVEVIKAIDRLITDEVTKAGEELKKLGYTGKRTKRKLGFFRKK